MNCSRGEIESAHNSGGLGPWGGGAAELGDGNLSALRCGRGAPKLASDTGAPGGQGESFERLPVSGPGAIWQGLATIGSSEGGLPWGLPPLEQS